MLIRTMAPNEDTAILLYEYPLIYNISSGGCQGIIQDMTPEEVLRLSSCRERAGLERDGILSSGA